MSLDRYCRQISLIGESNQLKISKASILVIGTGGIGSPLLLYLVAGGIGTVGFIDHDYVTASNLHRQILFDENDIGSPKSLVTYNKLKSLNSEIILNEYNSRLSIENARNIFLKYDLIIDGSDNFKTRYLVNDICCQLNKPFISSSIFQNKIQIIFFDINNGCYRCIFPEPPPPFLMQNCSEAGVLGPTAGIAGSMAASLAIKYFTDPIDMPVQKIISFDANKLKTDHLPFSQNKLCISCHHKIVSWPAKDYSLIRKDINLGDYLIIDIREHSEDRHIKLTSYTF